MGFVECAEPQKAAPNALAATCSTGRGNTQGDELGKGDLTLLEELGVQHGTGIVSGIPCHQEPRLCLRQPGA